MVNFGTQKGLFLVLWCLYFQFCDVVILLVDVLVFNVIIPTFWTQLSLIDYTVVFND